MSSPLLTTLLHLALATLAMAAPTMTIQKENAWQYGAGGGVIGFIVFILDVIVIGKSSLLLVFYVLSTSSLT